MKGRPAQGGNRGSSRYHADPRRASMKGRTSKSGD
jgi:hypothetical protein